MTQIPGMAIPVTITALPQAASVSSLARFPIAQNGRTESATIAQALAAADAAPTDATYFVLSSSLLLTNERVLQFNATQFTPVDNGAGLTYVVSLNFASAATPLSDAVAAVIGTSIVPARSDHQHPINVSGSDPYPVVGVAAPGTEATYARSDHRHGAPPAFAGATAFADGTLGGVTKPLAGEQEYFLRGDGLWTAAPGTGTVTSVGLAAPAIFSVTGSPVTTSGTLTLALAVQVMNRVWAGPATGADAAPTFRALVAADIPDISTDKLTSGILGIARGGTSAGTAQGARLAILPAVAGQANKALVVNAGETDFTYAAVGTGSVTSIGLAGTAAEITVTGASPITTSGSWTLSLPSALTFTGKTITGGDFTGGTWNNGVIGGSTPLAGSFTALTATQTGAIPVTVNISDTASVPGLQITNTSDASSVAKVASIRLRGTDTVSTAKTAVEFSATPADANYVGVDLVTSVRGSDTVTERMRIASTGVITLGAGVASSSLRVTPTASSVNFVDVAGGASGTAATLSAVGSGTDLDLRLTPKGTGYVYATSGGIKFPDSTTQTTAATSGLSLAQVQAAAVSL